MKKKFLSLLLVLSFVLTSVSTVFAIELPKEDADLSGKTVIIHTNDTHGRMVADDYNKQLGFAAVSGVKKAFLKAGAEVLTLDAGDTLHGLPIATINKGSDVVSVLNAVGYDAMTPGNHDFNYGTDRLTELAAEMDFPLLASNILDKETNQPIYDSSIVIEKGGIKFGIFGLSTTETAYKTNPKNVEAVTFANPVSYAKKSVDALKAQHVDCIIALGHIGVDPSSDYTTDKIVSQMSGIDIFIDGHSHTPMENGKPVDSGLALAKSKSGTLVASSGQYIENIGVIIINEDGSMEAGLIPYSEEVPTDEEIVAQLATITEAQDVALSEVVGETTVQLNGEREVNRKQESNLGNLTADAMKEATGADLAFTNGGGIRASIAEGKITRKDLVTVFPFGNYVVTKNVTGQAIVDTMEHGVKDYPELSGGFPQVSGITFKFDESKPAGSRVYDVQINGEDIDLEATYLLATNDFLAAGGDAYTMLAEFDIVNEFGSLEEIIANYIAANPDFATEVQGRILSAGAAVAAPVEEAADEPAEEEAPVEEAA